MPTIGTAFNRWITISEPYMENGHTMVRLRCSCGVEAVKRLALVKHGTPRSCGCLKRELLVAKNKKGRFEVTVGERFGRLTLIKELPASADGYRIVECLCDCGQATTTQLSSALSGHSKSCGCLRSEMVSAKNLTHGKSKTAIYSVWASMKERCESESCPAYGNYGGRGIRVCKKWSESFEAFYADMGEPPFLGASLDRGNNDGDYTKSNVRWATRAEQAANTRRNKLYPYKGQPTMLKDIAIAEQINLGTLYYRVNTMKLGVEQALVLHFNKETK